MSDILSPNTDHHILDAPEPDPPIDSVCPWEQDDCDSYYQTDCGECFEFTYGSRDENFKFCPYCGKQIVELPTLGEK